MAFDAFLRIEGVAGESTDDQHPDWIEILSYSHALSQPIGGSVSTAGGAAAERCDHGVFTVVKALDAASPLLAEACCKGSHLSEVVLSLNRAGGDKLEYMQYKMTQVLVTSVRPGGSASGMEALPIEEIGFSYATIDWTYTKQKREDGTGGGQIATGWDLTLNKPR